MADAVIGYVHPGWVRAEFCASLLGICMEGQTRIRTVVALESGPNISTARNLIVRDFLGGGLAPWLFMADTDMVLDSDTVDRLIEAADPVERPVVGALCYSLEGGVKLPVLYELTQKDGGELAFVRLTSWPEDAVIQVTATGAACLLVHRDALLAVEKFVNEPWAPWFRESPVAAALSLMGEDMTFCLRCGGAGIPVHVATGVKAGHMKTQMLI